MKTTRIALMMAATYLATAMIAPVMAADGKGGAATQAAATTKKPTDSKRASIKQRRADCEKQAEGKTGIERKKFIRECVHGNAAAKPPATPIAAGIAKPAAPARPTAPVKPASPTEPVAQTPTHKDVYPSERLRNNPRLRARSCLQDARDQGLTPPALQAYMKDCANSK